MNYDNVNACVASIPINDCCESDTSRTMIDNLKATTELLHMIEGRLDTIRGSLWFNDGSNPEKDIEIKDIEIKDMDSNLVHNRDVAKRILKKLDTMVARIGC